MEFKNHLKKKYLSLKKSLATILQRLFFSYKPVKSDRYFQTDGMRETETENYIDIFREIKGENEEESERQTNISAQTRTEKDTKSWNKRKGE